MFIYIPAILTMQFDLAITLVLAALTAFIAARPLIVRTRLLSINVSKAMSSLSTEFIQFVHAFPYLKATATLAICASMSAKVSIPSPGSNCGWACGWQF